MPVPIAAYDDGLTHYTFQYLSDAGVTFSVSIRAAYIDDGTISTPANPAKTPVDHPKALKPRHLILTSTTSDGGAFLKRKVPCNFDDIENYFPDGQTQPQTVTVDGEVWYVTGYHGETWRG